MKYLINIMKYIMENWRKFKNSADFKDAGSSFAETDNQDLHTTYNVYFCGSKGRGVPQNPSEVLNSLYDLPGFKQWLYNNGNLIIMPMTAERVTLPEGFEVQKVIGFSAGAKAAVKFSSRYPGSELILIDPWMLPISGEDFDKKATRFKFYGPSCYFTTDRLKSADANKRKTGNWHIHKLKKFKLIPSRKWKCVKKSHMSFFRDYFQGNLG